MPAGILPELFTGSTPLYRFFNPGVLLLLFLGYGLAILLLRELAVRWNVGLRGLLLFGLAYNTFNEDLWPREPAYSLPNLLKIKQIIIAEEGGFGVHPLIDSVELTDFHRRRTITMRAIRAFRVRITHAAF